MDRASLKILRVVAKQGEVSLAKAVRLAPIRHKSHIDQYPLALLLEAGYLGMTIRHSPPEGAEEMREFSLATTLHMFTLPKDAHGVVHYMGIKSSGTIDPEKQQIFMKAKGALYLDELAQSFRDRLWSFVLGFAAGLLTAVASAWVKSKLSLP